MAEARQFEFKAEIKQLLDILVHSLYTNKQIFVRELVSNASDALDKMRIEAAKTDHDDEIDLEIRIDADKDANILTIADTGIGMTAGEMEENLGTIAHSGTAAFAKAAAEGKQSVDSLIGRFGVGFYSVYMAADKVEVDSRSFAADAKPVRWTSDGQGGYTISDLPADTPRGTTVRVFLKDDVAAEFTSPDVLRSIIKKHSNFISFPILVDGERVNTVPALWREPKFQISDEQYKEFYEFLTFDSEGPFETIHISVDAPVQFNALLFVPPRADDMMMGMDRDHWGLDLYVRRVLIEHENKNLLPEYLGFMKGVVDTEDLPLNISRETLQDNLLMRKIQTTLVKEILGRLGKLAEDDEERYAEFFRLHGRMLKAGYMDFMNRDKITPLLRFNSSALDNARALTSLDGYIDRAKQGQKTIYYASGQSREALALNPHLEIFRRKGVEVLYLFDPIDEFLMDAFREYKEFSLKAAELADAADLETLEDVVKPKAARKMSKKDEEALPGLLAKVKEVLGDKVVDVRSTDRLQESPACLSGPDGQMSSSMDKVMRAIQNDQSVPKKVLELNPDHPLTRNMLKIYHKNADDEFIAQAANQLYESAMLLEGYLTDPHALVGRIQDLLTKSSGWYAKTL